MTTYGAKWVNLHSKICIHTSVCSRHLKCLEKQIFRNGGSSIYSLGSISQWNMWMFIRYLLSLIVVAKESCMLYNPGEDRYCFPTSCTCHIYRCRFKTSLQHIISIVWAYKIFTDVLFLGRTPPLLFPFMIDFLHQRRDWQEKSCKGIEERKWESCLYSSI